MALVARELIESRPNSEEPGRLGTVRIFQVDATPDVAKTATGLPVMNEPLPWDSTQKVLSIIVDYERGSVATSRITVTYGKGGSFGGANPRDPTFQSWTLSYFRVAVPILYAIQDGRTFHYVGSPAQGTIFLNSYPVNSISHWESRKKFIRRLRVTHMLPTDWEPIGDQSNTLHKIYSRWYLFNIGDLQEVGPAVWDVSYTWEYDSGTPDAPYLAAMGLDNRIRFPFGRTAVDPLMTGGFYTRPPFHSMTTCPKVDGSGNPTWPDFILNCDYKLNPNGWMTLPGMTL